MKRDGKSKLWNVRLSEADRKRLRQNAEKAHMSVPAYFRWLIWQRIDVPALKESKP